MIQKLYRYLFWTGYVAVLITTFIPINSELNKIRVGQITFNIRLDLLLHLLVYFLICMYYLFGIRKGITLFETHSLGKFILVILLLATITEVIQLWVPERAFNPVDWVANVAGVVFGVIVIEMVQRRKGMTA